MNELIIITGYSRGIGREIAEGYARARGETLGLIGISRTAVRELESGLYAGCRWFRSLRADLSDHTRQRSLLEELSDLADQFEREHGRPDQVTLINNAAMLGPLVLYSSVWRDDGLINESAHAINANCLAPALLSGWFVDRYGDLQSPHKTILNISSGASKGPMPGAGIYSMSKAALNMISMSLAAEQQQAIWPVKAISLSPGMVETAMQDIIRSQDAEDFPEVEFFRSAATDGKVRSPGKWLKASSLWTSRAWRAAGTTISGILPDREIPRGAAGPAGCVQREIITTSDRLRTR
jgi:benzil reductase ((S)-benzoin forming)